MPRNSGPSPSGQFFAYTRSCKVFSISSSNSSGSFAGRSILLTNVKIGIPRIRQISNSFSVCDSMPFAASMTMITESTAISTRYVSSEKSLWPGVSSKLTTHPA